METGMAIALRGDEHELARAIGFEDGGGEDAFDQLTLEGVELFRADDDGLGRIGSRVAVFERAGELVERVGVGDQDVGPAGVERADELLLAREVHVETVEDAPAIKAIVERVLAALQRRSASEWDAPEIELLASRGGAGPGI